MKYFFFDVDGTLTNIKTGEFIQSGLDTIKKLEEKGNFVAIATGRAYYKTIPAARKAGIHNFVANGGAALIINDKLIRNAPLDKEKALKIIHEVDALGYGILVANSDSIDVLMKDHRFLEQAGERKEPTNYIYQPDLKFEDIDEKGHNPRRKAQDPDGVGGSDVAGPVLGEVHPPDTPHDAPAQAEAAGVADQK